VRTTAVGVRTILIDKREYQRCWRAENSERARERVRRWRAENPEKYSAHKRHRGAENAEQHRTRSRQRRARKRSVMGDFTSEQFKTLCAHFKHHCLKCGRPRRLEADHVIPLAWADRLEYKDVALNDIENVQPLCKPCNSGKRDTYVDYRTQPHRNCILHRWWRII